MVAKQGALYSIKISKTNEEIMSKMRLSVKIPKKYPNRSNDGCKDG